MMAVAYCVCMFKKTQWPSVLPEKFHSIREEKSFLMPIQWNLP